MLFGTALGVPEGVGVVGVDLQLLAASARRAEADLAKIG
jgi:hypothetical protein